MAVSWSVNRVSKYSGCFWTLFQTEGLKTTFKAIMALIDVKGFSLKVVNKETCSRWQDVCKQAFPVSESRCVTDEQTEGGD